MTKWTLQFWKSPTRVGEVMKMCLTPAVTAAVHDATGVWFEHFPLVPEEVLKGIAVTRKN
jgi:CO/xanthine dehydrogenase Mo-binding subunit